MREGLKADEEKYRVDQGDEDTKEEAKKLEDEEERKKMEEANGNENALEINLSF